MVERVLLLGELVALLAGDFAIINSTSPDIGTTLSKLPKAAFGAALAWSSFYFLADLGAGSVAVLLGLLVTVAYLLGQAGYLTTSIQDWIKRFEG